MSTCKEIAARVTAYMERELSWPEWIAFKLHLAMCRFCRRYVAQMETTRAALRRLGTRAPQSSGTIDPGVREAFRVWRDESAP